MILKDTIVSTPMYLKILNNSNNNKKVIYDF